MKTLDISNFIKKHIIFRNESMFDNDINLNKNKLVDSIYNKSVLVIGGAGSIGSSFIKELLNYKPSKLIVVDINENGLTELTRDLRSTLDLAIPNYYKTYAMSFDDLIFYKMFKNEGPFDIIANFAAHKHVRSEKDHYSIFSLIENNIFKAELLLKELKKFPPKHFFCVSTDKASNPANIMGASKKIMEELIMAYSDHYSITTARFANVAFSNGSLLDGFISRIFKKQPISAPTDVKRYFVSPKESGQICLIACVLGSTGEIFFPKLKQSQMLTFSDISNSFLKYMGYKPLVCRSEQEAKEKANKLDKDSTEYPVYYFKTETSGEKDFEEFFTNNEKIDLNRFNNLGVIKKSSKKSIKEMDRIIAELKNILLENSFNKQKIVLKLQEIVPEFNHIETGKNLDEKM